MPLQSSFDYQAINLENRITVQKRTQELKERLQRTAQDVYEIGQGLADVRARLKHGQFESWLKSEFGWSRRTAYNFINVYESFGESAKFAQTNIATSALYLLASPSTPQDIREKFIQQASSGEKLNYKDIRNAVDQKKSEYKHPVGSITSTKPGAAPQVISAVPTKEGRSITEVQKLNHASRATPSTRNSQMGWYLLESQHLLFCGDTTSNQFTDRLPQAAVAFGIASDRWNCDWLVNKAKSVLILQQATVLQEKMIEQVLLMFSQPEDAVLFPWLPSGEIIAVVHNLKRRVYTGEISFELCSQAIADSGLKAKKVSLL